MSILIVDDETRLDRAWTTVLQSKGFECSWTTNAEEGRELVARLAPDIVLLNRSIYAKKQDPDGTDRIQHGMELIRAIKKYNAENLMDTKIIAVSGVPSETVEIERFFREHADSLLEKTPLTEETLQTEIRNTAKHNEELEIIQRNVTIDDAKLNLLKKLFHEATRIIVFPLIPGYSGANVFRIDVYDFEGPKESVFTKIASDKGQISEEWQNYQKYVKGRVALGKNVRFDEERGVRYTKDLAGFVGTFIGSDFVSITSLSHFYQETEDIKKIKDCLKDLFEVALGEWHRVSKKLRVRDYAFNIYESLRLFDENILFALFEKHFKEFENKEYLQDKTLDRRLYHPRFILQNVDKGRTFQIYECICHGDLRCDNVLLDKNKGSVWLIDFAHTGIKPLLADFMKLETSIKFELMKRCDEADFLMFEKNFAVQKKFGESVSIPKTDNKDLTKAFKAIRFIREYAGKINSPYTDFSEYLYGLLFFTLAFLKFEKIELWRRKQCLISSSMIFEKLR